jgi:hypothetical protein
LSFPPEDGKEPGKPQKKRAWSRMGTLILGYEELAPEKDAMLYVSRPLYVIRLSI